MPDGLVDVFDILQIFLNRGDAEIMYILVIVTDGFGGLVYLAGPFIEPNFGEAKGVRSS